MDHNENPELKEQRITPARQERWAQKGRETFETLTVPRVLKDSIRRSLDTPQFGPYHNEGFLMDAHLGLMMENIENISNGTFDFSQLGLPDDRTVAVRAMVERVLQTHATEMAFYVYLHDIKKPDCMNVETKNADGKKQQRIFTMEEWQTMRDACEGDEAKIREAFEAQGITKIGYRHSHELTGRGEKDHGPEAKYFFREVAARDPESAEFLKGRALVIKGIANHEMHFQVFSAAKSGKQFEAKLATVFSPEEIEFILTVNMLDITASLDENGAANYQGFRNMCEARDAYICITQFCAARAAEGKSLEVHEVAMLMNQKGIDAVREKIEQVKNPPRTNLYAEELEAITAQLPTWMRDLGIPEERKKDIDAALQSDHYERALGQLGLGKLAKTIRQMFVKP